jgi:hypothetical protein
MAGPEAVEYAVWFTGTVAEVISERVSVQRERLHCGRRVRGGGSVAQSLRNRDAGDSDARHFADGHLEQEIQHLEGLAVPAC